MKHNNFKIKFTLFLFGLFFTTKSQTQNVQVDSNTYTAQQLIENILINSSCISNVIVTNVSGGNFGGTDQSYGYFNANGSSFPFQSGIVLSTGKLSNVAGPNTTLSDDNAPNWLGDSDLETILNETNTINATIIEFEFTAQAYQISFRYLFASEEYQINNPNTCQYSDLFGFLIRNVTDTQYENIALIPNTQTPVKVTTVHPAIQGGCIAQNETYFGSWNNNTAPINFNGQTSILTATANTIPNETYHIKLVIADEKNYRYDSAVFLEAGSFKLSTNLGVDRLIVTNNPLCENSTLLLDATQTNAASYTWFKNGVVLTGETNSTLSVTNAGFYNVEVTLQNNCKSYGNITIETVPGPIVSNTTLINCDTNNNGLSTYNLYDAEQTITNANSNLSIVDFFRSLTDAQFAVNPIPNPSSFSNTSAQQVVFARVENQNGCYSISEITLNTANNTINLPDFQICDDTTNDGITEFRILDLNNFIANTLPSNSISKFYFTKADAITKTNEISGSFFNKIPFSDTVYVNIENYGSCYAISKLNLIVNKTPLPKSNATAIYCLPSYPRTINISAGIPQDYNGSNYSYKWFLDNQPLTFNGPTININQAGTYKVIETNASGCSVTGSIEVIASKPALIQSVEVKQGISNNTIIINISGQGNYQFALDNPIFQNENSFENVKAGIHTVYVYDTNGCGTVTKKVAVIGFPKYFTPNNDGINDLWKPLGINSQFNSNSNIKIFNRYGKFIKELNPLEAGWNGTIKGKLMQTDDYWYVVTMPDGTVFRGHFSLKQ